MLKQKKQKPKEAELIIGKMFEYVSVGEASGNLELGARLPLPLKLA